MSMFNDQATTLDELTSSDAGQDIPSAQQGDAPVDEQQLSKGSDIIEHVDAVATSPQQHRDIGSAHIPSSPSKAQHIHHKVQPSPKHQSPPKHSIPTYAPQVSTNATYSIAEDSGPFSRSSIAMPILGTYQPFGSSSSPYDDLIVRPMPTLQKTHQSISSKKPEPVAQDSTILTERDWVSSALDSAISNSRERPRTMGDLCKDVTSFRLFSRGTSGANDSMHYPIKMLKKDTPNSVVHADKSNSFSPPYYYVDTTVDIAASRLRSRYLDLGGYYEINAPISKVSPGNMDSISKMDDYLAASIKEDGELRRAIWEVQEGSYFLSARVFETISSKKGSSSKGTKLPPIKGVEIIYISTDRSGNVSSTYLDVKDNEYLNFTGAARLVFTPSVLTAVGAYKKIVYKCSTMILTPGKMKLKGGIATDVQQSQQAPKDKDWEELVALLKIMVDKGTKASELTTYLKQCLSKKSAEVVQYKKKQQQHREEDNEEESEEEDKGEESEEEESEEEDSEDERLKSRHSSKNPQQMSNKGKAPAPKVLDPPSTDKLSKTKPKYTFKK